jgi:hypothetical protein
MDTAETQRRRVAVPGGSAALIAEVAVPAARGGEELVLQRLEADDGPLVRLGYRRGGAVVRGPVSATPGELRQLAAAARAAPALAELLGGAGGPPALSVRNA